MVMSCVMGLSIASSRFLEVQLILLSSFPGVCVQYLFQEDSILLILILRKSSNVSLLSCLYEDVIVCLVSFFFVCFFFLEQSSESSLLWLQWGITFSQLERDTLKYAMYRAICLLGSLLCMHRSIAQIHWSCLLQIGFEVSPLYLMTLKGKTNQKTGWNVILGQASEMNYAWLQWMTRINTGIKLAINALCFGFFLHFCS